MDEYEKKMLLINILAKTDWHIVIPESEKGKYTAMKASYGSKGERISFMQDQ